MGASGQGRGDGARVDAMGERVVVAGFGRGAGAAEREWCAIFH